MAGTPPITIASPDGQHVELCQYRTTPKKIFVKALCPDFRTLLCSELPPSRGLQ